MTRDAAPVLMVLGTASGVGKSVITAGLCRALARRGHRVAPFKAQNMSLNAYVTRDGGEIGRSTAVQAEAAGIEVTVDMNPILLKPEADARSQVIVRGRVFRSVSARDYTRGTLDLWPIVVESLDRLRREYDVVVAEGAGSPVEMNLRNRDIVNMRVALHTNATVVLVADIDRGGVFAQVVGTLDLLPPDERNLVTGIIVNRFRGDPSMFEDGVQMLASLARTRVLGVVPAVPDLDLPEEDSVTLERDGTERGRGDVWLRISVPRLPRIANFDDFGPLERAGGVSVTYVDRPSALDDVDAIVIPGTKSTVADLTFLRERGLDRAIVAAHDRGTPVLGICGGFQMLGQRILDPDGVESPETDVRGLGLLPLDTTFHPAKRTRRVRARVIALAGPLAPAAGSEITAYEIHAGESAVRDAGLANAFEIEGIEDGWTRDGLVSADGLVTGTYLHGIFANDAIRDGFLGWLADRKGVTVPSGGSASDPHDRWADTLERTLDLDRLFEAVGVESRS
ncbi:MAG: cobyric acid synthase [Chloroflexota bacterium]|nr:MAG: cobyric acid synthase [Chloroflexota bacterium]